MVIIYRDILQFAVNRTDDGVLYIAHQDALKYLKENSNAISVGLVKEGVGTCFRSIQIFVFFFYLLSVIIFHFSFRDS